MGEQLLDAVSDRFSPSSVTLHRESRSEIDAEGVGRPAAYRRLEPGRVRAGSCAQLAGIHITPGRFRAPACP